MKLAATDFDGTFCPIRSRVPEANIEAVEAWQAAGHKFGINTGRGIGLIHYELVKYETLVPDFLICNNGAVVVGRNGEILASLTYPEALLRGVLSLPRFADGEDPLLIITERETFSLRPNPDVELGIGEMPEVTLEAAMAMKDVVQLSMRCQTTAAAEQTAAEVHAAFPETTGNINRNYLDLNLQGANKAEGVARLLAATGWQVAPDDLFVIGDDKNDLPAIERYHGYTVETATDSVKRAARAVYPTVGAMLRENL